MVCTLSACTLVAGGCGGGEAEGPTEPAAVDFAPVQPELFGAGGTLTDAWADFDGDGDPDRFVGFNGAPSRLYRNDRDAGFIDVAAAVGIAVERAVRTSAWGDYDGDGDPDLLLGFAGDAPVTALLRNDGAAGFTEVAAQVGLLLSEGATRQASWIDFDADGDLDLFLALRDRANLMFRNEGAGGFVDVTTETGLGDPRRTVGAVWLDMDVDGDLDLVVANMDGDANGVWRNDGGTFTDVAGDAPVAAGGRALGDPAQGSVRVCAADVYGDGVFDLFFANYGPNALLRGERPGEWSAPAVEDGLSVDSRFDTCAWGDFDNDGALDLYVNGTVGGGVHYRDYLFRRQGSDVFADVTTPGLLALNASHGVTWVDFDLDGDLDLALAGSAGDAMHHLLENRLPSTLAARSLQVRVLDEAGRATRPGAEVRVYAAGSDRLLGTRLVDTGSGYDAQSDLPLHFGLDDHDGPVDIAVTVTTTGGRVTGRLDGIDPASHRGAALTLRVDDAGAVERNGSR
jgi:hypothetical protein